MTRRRGIIAALAAIVGAHVPRGAAAPPVPTRYFSIVLDPIEPLIRPEMDWEATKKFHAEGGSEYIMVTKSLPPPTPVGIEVRLGDRVVRLSAEEIMDALTVTEWPADHQIR